MCKYFKIVNYYYFTKYKSFRIITKTKTVWHKNLKLNMKLL